MKRGKSMWVSDEFIQFIKDIRREYKINTDIEATTLLVKNRGRMKGTVLDLFVLMLVLMIFSLSSIFGYYLLTQYKDTTMQYAAINTTPSQGILDSGLATLGYMDETAVFVLLGLSLSIIIGGFYLNLHPVVMGMSIFILVFVLLVSGILSNTMLEFFNVDTLSETVSHFPTTRFLWNNMPMIILAIGAILIIVMHARPSNEGGGGGFR